MTEIYQRLQLSLGVSFNTNQKLNQQIVSVRMNTAIDSWIENAPVKQTLRKRNKVKLSAIKLLPSANK